MRRSPVIRALIALWSLWFTATVLEVPWLHACPVHAGAAGHAAHAGMSHMRHAAARLAGSSADVAAPMPHSVACSCLGSCCGVGSVALLSTSSSLAAPAFAQRHGPSSAHRVSPAARPHALPFANAPPRASLS